MSLMRQRMRLESGSRIQLVAKTAHAKTPDTPINPQLTVSVWARPEETGMARQMCIVTKEPLKGPGDVGHALMHVI